MKILATVNAYPQLGNRKTVAHYLGAWLNGNKVMRAVLTESGFQGKGKISADRGHVVTAKFDSPACMFHWTVMLGDPGKPEVRVTLETTLNGRLEMLNVTYNQVIKEDSQEALEAALDQCVSKIAKNLAAEVRRAHKDRMAAMQQEQDDMVSNIEQPLRAPKPDSDDDDDEGDDEDADSENPAE